ncbi:MAG: hypothetical protein M3Q10_07200 [Chloroflexota bacterium]|nr:hypothetical protein [Chloroflexota bacterium]
MEARRRTLIGAGIGAGAGLLLVLWVAASEGGSFDPAAAVIVPVGLAALGAGIVAWVEGGKPFYLRQWVPLPPEAVHRHVTRWFASGGWTMQGGTDQALAFTRGGFADPNAGCLLLLGALPFLLLARPQQTLTLQTTRVPDGTELEIVVSPRAGGGQAAAARFFNSLHDLV